MLLFMYMYHLHQCKLISVPLLFSEFHRIIRSIKEGKLKKVSVMAEAHWTLPEGVPSPAPDSGPSQIIISSIPKNMSVGHLDYFFENECAMQEGSYNLELQKDGTALMTLTANDLKKEGTQVLYGIYCYMYIHT